MKTLLLPTLALASLLILNNSARAAEQQGPERFEFPVGQVFVPPQGYDDNDNIEIVLDGILPNGCYSVADYTANVDPSTKQIVPHLYVNHRRDSLCQDETHLSTALTPPVPYTLDLSVGTLGKGDYKIVYQRPGLPQEVRAFNVERAKTASVDDRPYAAVSSVWIPDSVRGDLTIHAELIGSLTSSCSKLSSVEVKRENDVFVVLPSLSFSQNLLCSLIMLPIQQTVDLGTPGEGRYLIHVRSMSGHSVNRAFSAVVPDPELSIKLK